MDVEHRASLHNLPEWFRYRHPYIGLTWVATRERPGYWTRVMQHSKQGPRTIKLYQDKQPSGWKAHGCCGVDGDTLLTDNLRMYECSKCGGLPKFQSWKYLASQIRKTGESPIRVRTGQQPLPATQTLTKGANGISRGKRVAYLARPYQLECM